MSGNCPKAHKVRSFNIDNQLDTQLRVLAAIRDTTVTALITEAIGLLMDSQNSNQTASV